jgi:hypothetical protein
VTLKSLNGIRRKVRETIITALAYMTYSIHKMNLISLFVPRKMRPEWKMKFELIKLVSWFVVHDADLHDYSELYGNADKED